MLTGFTLITGIIKNIGCNVGRGWERVVGGRRDWRNYKCSIKQMMKGEAGEGKGKGTCAKEVTGCRGEGGDGRNQGERKRGDW